MKFKVLYIDNPRTYANRRLVRKDGGRTRFGVGAAGKYDLLSDEAICQLPIKKLADPEGCVLFSWATSPNMPIDTVTIQRWGFNYATVPFVWVKTYESEEVFCGTGSYTLSNIEDLLGAGLTQEDVNDMLELLLDETIQLFAGRTGTKNPERTDRTLRQPQFAPHPRYAADHIKVLTGQEKAGAIVHSGKPQLFRTLLQRLYPGPRLEIFARDDAGPIPDDWYATGNELDGLDVKDAIEFYAALPDNTPPYLATLKATIHAHELTMQRKEHHTHDVTHNRYNSGTLYAPA